MINTSGYKQISEFYEVVKTVELVWNNRQLRIEALRDVKSGKFSTRGYWMKDILMDSGHIENSLPVSPTRERVWVNAGLPWTDRDDADAAIEQALSFLV